MSLLKLQDIGKIYVSENSVAVGIRDVNLEFDIGEFVAVTGKSGSGKTTLLNIISGMDTYEEGELYVGGEPTSHYSQSDWELYRQEYISFIFQDYNIIESFTVLQNVELALTGIESVKERRKRALELIDRVGMTKFKNHKGSKLSGGQKQRTVIARALAKDSPIILADEPTGNLDSQSSEEIIRLLAEISKEKLVIVVTHSFSQLEAYATREIRVYDGSIEKDESLRPAAIIPYESHFTTEQKEQNIKRGIELGWNRFKAMPKLTIFMCLLMMIAVLGTFYITASQITDMQVFEKNYMFTHVDGRVVLIRQDGNPITDDELGNLAGKVGAKDYIHYDSNLDNTINLFEQAGYGGRYLTCSLKYTIGTDLKPDVGRRPETDREVMLVLPISWQTIYGKDSIQRTNILLPGGEKLNVTVVGVKYYYDNTVNYGQIVCTREGFDMLGVDVLFLNGNIDDANYSEKLVSVAVTDYKGQYKISNMNGNQVKIDPELSGYEYYVVGDKMLAESIKTGSGETPVLNALLRGWAGDSERAVDEAVMNIEKTLDESLFDYKTMDGETLFISKELARALNIKFSYGSYLQASLFFKNDKEAEQSIAQLKELGYNAVASNATYEDPMKMMYYVEAIFNVFLWFLMIVFLSFFLSLCSSRAIMSKRADLAILRSMGIKNKVVKISMYVQTFIYMIPACIVFAITAVVVYMNPKTNSILPFMHLLQYVMIVLGLVLLNIFLTKRYNKKMFKESVRKTLRGGDKE